MGVGIGLGIGPGEGETGTGDNYQHARDAQAMGPARCMDMHSHTPGALHIGGSHMSILAHLGFLYTVSPVLGTWPPLETTVHQSGHLRSLPQLSGLGAWVLSGSPEVAQCDREGVELRAVRGQWGVRAGFVGS